MLSNNPQIVRELKKCRICGSKKLSPFLSLGEMPLVNTYLPPEEPRRAELRFPLTVLFCESCGLSQLSLVISPEILFSQYDYHSSISQTFGTHCDAMAQSLARDLPLVEDDLVVEIASNDGCLLSRFRDRGIRVCGVEPARNLVAIAEARALPTISGFWSKEVARRIEAEYGKAKLIVATNVLAHVDDLNSFLSAVALILDSSGVFVFEVPHLLALMDNTQFDTIYHEHLSYFLLKPLEFALAENGLAPIKVEKFDIHGGSIRVTAQLRSGKRIVDPSFELAVSEERSKGLYEYNSYSDFARRVEQLKLELVVLLRGLVSSGKTIAAYGASAKGNILLNFCNLGPETLAFVIDDTPAKQGKLFPGNRLPIVARDELFRKKPDYLLLLAWNFAHELMRNTAQYSVSGGRYIIPIPGLKIVSSKEKLEGV